MKTKDNMHKLTPPPSLEAFAEALRQDKDWRFVAHLEGNDHVTATLVKDGSRWQWDRQHGFQEIGGDK